MCDATALVMNLQVVMTYYQVCNMPSLWKYQWVFFFERQIGMSYSAANTEDTILVLKWI